MSEEYVVVTTVERTFHVEAPPGAVIDYLKDFGHAQEWDPGTESCTRSDSGPVQVGATWHNVSKIAGVSTELTYRLVELTDDRVVFEGSNDSARTTDTITATADGSGTRLHYRADIELQGAAKLATPAVKLVFEKIGNDTEKQLTQVLGRLAG